MTPMILFIQERFPGTTGTVGLSLTMVSRWLEGPSAVITFAIGACTLIIISPKAYRQLRIWCRFLRRICWPSRRRERS